MTSIVIYAAEPANPSGTSAQSERINGMIDAGMKLTQAYNTADTNSDGVLSDPEIEVAVCGVLDAFAAPGNGFEPVLEHKVGATTSFYSIAPRANPATSKFDLINKANPADTRKLELIGKADTFGPGNKHKMTIVAPLKANNANAWDYLYETVYLDLKQINAAGDNPVKTLNYLIATFAFTRCR